ncbi:MAG: NAD(+) synthase [Kiritimatiellia bacterium]|nr:NAD(+) synthase [Kiritimatiellia bacterium]
MTAERQSVRTRLEQIEVLPGRPRENTAHMLARIHAARTDGIRLVVFPEMAVPGYLLGDEWERASFLNECVACGEALRAASDGLVVVFGNVALDPARRNEDGRVRKYNAAFVAQDGAFMGPAGSAYPFVIKALLPNYREFDDSRHFFDLRKLALEEGQSLDALIAPVPTRVGRLGCLICEDAWDADYALSPLDALAANGADLFLNISASPYTLNKNHKRNRVFADHAERLKRPLVYVNKVGVQNNGKTVFTFEGQSCVYDAHGHHTDCGAPFEAASLTIDLPLDPAVSFGEPLELQEDSIDELRLALEFGMRRFLEQCGATRVVVGASGGIDSAVAAALCARILPPDQLLLVNMPSRYNSETTRHLAVELAENLGCLYAEVPIEESVATTIAQIDGLVARSPDGSMARELKLTPFMLENVQARDRSSRILAAVASAFGGVFTCNANKSEATVGYTTLYGDLGGFMACLADLWKGEVYELSVHLNAISPSPVIPQGSIDVMPSAELSADQAVDEQKGDPLVYPYHDRLFASWVEWWNRATPEENLRWYADGVLEKQIGYEGSVADLFPDAAAFIADLERWWNLYQGMGIAKRIQAPPVLGVKRRVFGFDHRESQMGPRYTRAYEALKAELLGRDL